MDTATLKEPKEPAACQGLEDIRAAIDHLDRQLIELLRRRKAYVLSAARFKPNEASIPAPERVTRMIADRRVWAEEAGLDPEFVVSLFEPTIDWFIELQIQHWRRQQNLVGGSRTP
ncbi:isochorismate-pyruvate lyase [Alkalilimnicola ehrlichii]|uniref:chorismate mutase n=1 Tax=Alkalilimnicola ehrlichii TaxID=351052 RepID=A0A3E0WUC3_9GAMM|nr:isochorismate lyase [Alkalilimnicola ehrlichii]RFA28586.1 isochorismate-pyruvate lyase [Alkalilimnicola ehrlichii]RFA35751.1 isochorismate-pyruvate lyase [Alkalilimnicola ehrlichii]